MNARSIKAGSVQELKDELEKTQAEYFIPTLGIVFVHIHFNMKEVSEAFSTSAISCIGASSAGEFIDGDFEQPSIVCLLMDLPATAYHLHLLDIEPGLENISDQLAKIGMQHFCKPAFILFPSGMTNDGEVILEKIQQGAGAEIPVYGGFASEDLQLRDTFVVVNDQVSTNGIAALILDSDQVAVDGMASGGWKTIGIVRTITSSKGNKVYSFDNEPALDLFARYMRLSVDDFRKGPAVVAGLFKRFQLQLQRPDRYPIMRAAIDADVEERSLVFSGHMPEGMKVQFSLLPSFNVVDNVIRDFEQFRLENGSPDAVLLFSCKAREWILGPLVTDEVERVGELWPVPMAGFFSYGEIGRVKDKSEFHSMICSLVLLKEK